MTIIASAPGRAGIIGNPTDGYGGSSSGTATTPDAYEDDDSFATATSLALDEVQDHSLCYGAGCAVSDYTDYFMFTVPY